MQGFPWYDSGMTDHKHALEEERKTLAAELGRLGRRDPETRGWEAVPEAASEADADPNDHADRFEDFEEKSAVMGPLETRLDEVERALLRIENGGYGHCTVCGNPIEAERLQANPAAETCMKHMG